MDSTKNRVIVNDFLLSEIDSTSNSECLLVSDTKQCIEYLNISTSTNTNYLSMICVNIRSIFRNLDLLLAYISTIDMRIDVIVLTECWLQPNNPPPAIEHYCMSYTKNCLNQNDGVVAYVHEEIPATFVEPEISEGNCLVITIDKEYSIICSYRPPCFRNPSNYINSLELILQSVATQNIIFTGDINLDILPNNVNNNTNSYLDLMAMYGLVPGVNLPTRVNTCIDHIMVKSCHPWKTIVFEQQLTDHSPILLYINKTGISRKNIAHSKLSIKYHDLLDQLSKETWTDLYSMNDVNTAVELFVNRLCLYISKNTKTTRVPKNKRPLKPWITFGVVRSIRKRDKLYKEMKRDPENISIRKKYIDYRNVCNKIIKTLKRQYYQSRLDMHSRNIKEIWKTIKEACNFNQNKISAFDLLSNQPNPIDSLNQVNNFFISVGQKLSDVILTKLNVTEQDLIRPPKIENTPGNSLALFLTDENEIKAIINSLRTSSAPGIDKITTTTLKKIILHVTKPITYLCNMSLQQGVFPDICKTSIVCPIYKSGDKCDPSNYRPISLLSTISKILEKLVNKRLVSFLEKNNLISEQQFGFRAKKSAEDAVLKLTNLITDSLDKKEACVGVFLDLRKAFDTVSIPILLMRLENVGIRGVPLEWFKTYLNDREQRVRIGETLSDVGINKFGVPQGSTLGPTLFLVYINEISKLSLPGMELLMFADDTVLVFHDKSWQSVATLAERGLAQVTSWLENSLLSLNTSKTKFLCFSKTSASAPAYDFRIKIHMYPCNRQTEFVSVACTCENLDRVTDIKYLGVIVDSNLSWKCHVATLTARVRKLIYIFKQLRTFATHQILIQSYKALCECLINYCICAWGNAAKTHLIQVERAQRALLKVMLYLPYRHPTVEVYKMANVLTVRKMYVYQILKRYHANVVPYIPKTSKRIDRCPVPLAHSKLAQRHFKVVAPRLYNKMNKTLKTKNMTKNKFKKVVLTWLNQMDYDEIESMLTSI